MKLCDHDIEVWLNEGKLIINPRPSIKSINGVTVDIRLGNQFRIFKGYTSAYVDLSKPKEEIYAMLNKIMSHEIVINKNQVFFLHPGELALAVTLECITLPNNLVGWLDGRSFLARLGLMIHATAHRIDPGWQGKIVLECYNSGKLPLALRPKMFIGALSFELLTNAAIRPYNKRKDAKYYNQKGTYPL